ncbi:homoserine kinase [Phycicoccus sp. Soil803]|uniref:homoserine kinase n=1 Tax=Phycicoccus sp. Soil803 TaxID=1736415 RepID=UPI00070FEF0F|nr:homoserine kinase [Phycicoccus sp. Soil803]KRF25642.1 homoserine kinase [Phycicoccus sp. Soil803]
MAELVVGSSVTARVPASSANLGPGFDSVGLALGLWDTCVATVTEEPGITVDVEGEGAADVPRDATHLVVRTMLRAWDELGVAPPRGLHLSCVNEVPHGRGLGSSATAIVTGIVAAQGLHQVCRGVTDGPDLTFANDLAARLEGHPDNSSASVYGGLTLSWSDSPDDGTRTLRLRPHPDLHALVLVPATQLSTAKARSVLPTQIRHGDAALNSARAALLVQALTSHPEHLLDATREWLHQEARRDSFSASMDLVDRLRGAGHAAVISGAGPSVLVLTRGDASAAIRSLTSNDWTVLDPGIPATGAQLSDLVRGEDT